jgi:hypothetical protein
VGTFIERAWRRSRVYRILSLGGYVAFNLPRCVTALGSVLLAGLAAVHVYVLATGAALPAYFVGYSTVVVAGCAFTIMALWPGLSSVRPQHGWRLGSVLCVIYSGLYLASRAASLPRLVGLSGRWDYAPATLALGCAAGFIAVHMSVLLDINVAYPQRRDWPD